MTGATLNGTLTVNAVAGVATFPNLLINKNGTGYTLVASSTGLTSATSNAFDIAVGAPSKLLFSVQPSGGVVNAAMSPAIVVNAQDSQGNPTPAFTGTVTLSLAANPTGATLGGTVSVSAVAGVATFPGVTVSATGSGFTLTAASTGLTSATSALFDIGGGSATSIVVASGGGQTGIPGAALASPVVIQVNDAAGVGIAGSTVNFAVATGGGSVTPTSGVTNAQGRVQTNWTLGAPLGAQTITATSAGLLGSPLTITATAAVGPVAQLVITTQPSNAIAGVPISPAITVTAKDASNNVVTSFVGTVTLAFGANPGAATLSGATATAVAGVATFSTVSLNKIGTGYTLVASSGASTSAASSAFNVTAAAASSLAITSGQNQTGNTLAPLATPLGVTVTDAFGNPVAGITVNWTTSGGATMSPASSVTSSTGIATSSWTLGSTPGAQTATATSGTLAGSPATFNATATLAGFSKTWTGATSTAWAVATNWTPAGVPVAGDSVFIPSGGNQPTISTAITVKHLTVGFGATLTFASSPTLTVTGNFTDNGTTAGAGTIDLNGTGTVAGPIAQNVTVSGTYSATSTVTAAGSISVGGSFTLGGHSVNVGGTFATSGTGTITMTNVSDVLTVSGDMTFAGGSETGKISAGAITTAGNFTQSTTATAFVAGGTNTVTLQAAAARTVSMPGAPSSGFANLTVSNPAGVTLTSNVLVNGNMLLSAGAVTGSGFTMGIGGTLTDPSTLLAVSNIVFVTGATPVAATTPVINSNVSFQGNPSALAANLTVNGSATVSSSGQLGFGGHTLTVNGNFATTSSGTISMVAALDAIVVNGNVAFGGGNTSGLITNGTLTFSGSFAQTNSSGGAEFSPAGSHTTILSGGSAQSLSFATPDTAANNPC
ncbi:MAG TPA: Ig-like domain-containing protein, partial [Gemmatimonadaceae bacterium]|nr:Ig-like domain-containing protein [Gemmatimonadaceae bacterium]